MNVLEGTFALTAGNSRGYARAVRMIEGTPVEAAPFVCEGAIITDEAPESAAEDSVAPSDDT
ncbi:MAG: hypothetical protein HRT80_01450 [Henriciella sp.]|nr:hypothetical protein [Henriciella sp.]